MATLLPPASTCCSASTEGRHQSHVAARSPPHRLRPLYILAIPAAYLLLSIYSIVNMNNVSWGTGDHAPRRLRQPAAATRRPLNKMESCQVLPMSLSKRLPPYCRQYDPEPPTAATGYELRPYIAEPGPQNTIVESGPQNTIVEDRETLQGS
ncbi:unnamed protein product [Lota lota]